MCIYTCMHMCIYIKICMYIVYADTYIYIYIYVYIYTHTHTHTYIYIYIYIYVYIYIYIYIYLYIYVYIYISIHIHVDAYVQVCVCIHVCVQKTWMCTLGVMSTRVRTRDCVKFNSDFNVPILCLATPSGTLSQQGFYESAGARSGL